MTEDEARQRVIRSMCPARVCRTCGEPSRRILGETRFVDRRGVDVTGQYIPGRSYEGNKPVPRQPGSNWGRSKVAPTLGFSDCGHDDWRPGVVLDPFQTESEEVMLTLGNIDQ